MAYLYLAIAIVSEVGATIALKASDDLTKIVPTALSIGGYALAFYCLVLVIRTLPVGITYAVWSGLGIVLVTFFSAMIYDQIPDWPAIIGMLLIVIGVAVIHMFSNTVQI